MPRRSSRIQDAAGASDPAPKVASVDAALATATTPSTTKRNKKRTRTQTESPSSSTLRKNPVKTTAKKSQYFDDLESHASDAAYDDTSIDAQDAQPASSEAQSGIAVTDDLDTGLESEDERLGPKKRGRRGTGTKTIKGQELWREGVRTGLGPGKEVFIKKPKARSPGGILYQDEIIHPNTILFLQDLKENNERQWLKAHDADYRTAKRDWDTFVESLTKRIIDQDSTIPELPAKDLVFRIHRDIRFSKDPTPYKVCKGDPEPHPSPPSRSCVLSDAERPGSANSIVILVAGSGLWMPDADRLALLRQNIDRDSRRLKRVLRAAGLRREFFDGIPDDDDEVVQAFVRQNQDSALKTKPKGYAQDNPNLALLRLRSFTIGRPLADDVLLSRHVQNVLVEKMAIMVPFSPERLPPEDIHGSSSGEVLFWPNEVAGWGRQVVNPASRREGEWVETQKTNHIVPINQVTYLNSVVMPDLANNNDDDNDNDSDSDDPDDNDSDDDDGDDLSDQDDESANDL
ncbi:Conserved hypothetical protein (DUF2461) domain containing protein [Elaphomyces granulatus]